MEFVLGLHEGEQRQQFGNVDFLDLEYYISTA